MSSQDVALYLAEVASNERKLEYCRQILAANTNFIPEAIFSLNSPQPRTSISRGDFVELLRSLALSSSQQEIELAFTYFQTQAKNYLTIEEFSSLITPQIDQSLKSLVARRSQCDFKVDYGPNNFLIILLFILQQVNELLDPTSFSQLSEVSQKDNKYSQDILKQGRAKLLSCEESFTEYSKKSIQYISLQTTNQQIQRDEQNRCIKMLYGNFSNLCQSLGDYSRNLFNNQQLFLSLNEILQSIEDEEVQENIKILTQEYDMLNKRYDKHYPERRESGLNRILPQQVLRQRLMRFKKTKKIKSILQKDKE